MAQQTVCGFVGNSDTYGLGVRIGVYLSWTTPILAQLVLPESTVEATDSLIIFEIALLAATFLITVRRENTYEVEIFIMLYMYFVGLAVYLLCASMPPSYGRPRSLRFSLVRAGVQGVSTLIMGVYCLWFLIKHSIFNATPCSNWIYPQRQLAFIFLAVVFAGVCVFIVLPMALWVPDVFTAAESYWRQTFPNREAKYWPRINSFGRSTFWWYKGFVQSLADYVKVASRRWRGQGALSVDEQLSEKEQSLNMYVILS
jgi:hypothetical protein